MYLCPKLNNWVLSISLLFNNTDNISLSALKTINLKKDMIKTLTISGENIIPNLSKETGYSIPTITKLMGEILGRYLAMLVNIFNPELVIIGGALVEASDYLQLPVQMALKRHSLNLVNQDVRFKTSKLGEKAGFVGVCYIVRDKFFGLI